MLPSLDIHYKSFFPFLFLFEVIFILVKLRRENIKWAPCLWQCCRVHCLGGSSITLTFQLHLVICIKIKRQRLLSSEKLPSLSPWVFLPSLVTLQTRIIISKGKEYKYLSLWFMNIFENILSRSNFSLPLVDMTPIYLCYQSQGQRMLEVKM